MNLIKFNNHSSKIFIIKLNEIILEILLYFMNQRQEPKSNHDNFLFKLIFQQILDKNTILSILSEIKKWKFIYKNKWGEKHFEHEMNKCIFLNTCVYKLFFIIQIIFRDDYLISNETTEFNYNLKINEYMSLMYLDVNPLDKYRYFSDLINSDTYYNELKSFKPKHLKGGYSNQDHSLLKEFTNLYGEMKKLGMSFDDEMTPIIQYEGEIRIKNELNNELMSAYYEIFSKLFKSETFSLVEIRKQMYKKENCRNEKFNKHFNKDVEKALSVSCNKYWIMQMIFKIRHYSESFEEYFITFLSLYLYNKKTRLDLIYSLEIHKPIKGLLSTSIISLTFIYKFLVLSGASDKEFINKSVFLYISFIINQLNFISEDIEKITYILKIMSLINNYSKYSNAKIGRKMNDSTQK